jgi:bifunctional non-homologous end joining protein LigD
MAKPEGDRLDAYRAKRRASDTPEPFGGPQVERPRLFVVQKHHATSLHYDLRLEWEGVLLSWAVPKGPSRDPQVKRLAMRTEDHPVEYADFEGVIPEGNYGAGHVIVWDQGSWVPRGDPAAGLAEGKLVFELKGQKLHGEWTLFRTKRSGDDGREWLFMKHRDHWARAPDEEDGWSEASVFSGRTVEELREGVDRADAVRARMEELGAPRAPLDAGDVQVMLARNGTRVFSSPDWIYELKYDGFRLLCTKSGDDVKLLYRSGRDATPLYPEVVRALRLLPFDSLIIDTEVVVLDDEAHPDFQRLQQRAQQTRPRDIEIAAVTHPVVCYAFDLLACEEFDLRGLPLVQRKELLRAVLPPASVVRYADHVEEHGEALYAQVEELGLEGLIAKKADSAYHGGRSDTWLKLKAERTGDFVVVGWTSPKGGRTGFGALHLAAYDGGELCYVGRVGTGFTDKALADIHALLEPLRLDEPPCTGPVPRTRGHYWVAPALVCEVRYKERTDDGLLRHPAFVRLREDKKPEECEAPPARLVDEPEVPVVEAEERHFTPTNVAKVFWPEEGFTKGDLIAYYRAVASWMLPYLRDRPVVLTRYPDGIEGKSFYQKDAPEWIPAWVRTERIWSEHTQREIDYFLCDDAESLAFLANMGSIPIHVWSSRVTDLARPDWCILDLDPKGAPFADVIAVARAIRALCESVEMPCFVKTSGSTGLHVLVPLGGQCTYEQSRALGELVARVIEAELPDIATTTRAIRKREGKVYLDYLQNIHGQLLVAPFSARPRPGATVSAPLHWDEVTDDLTIERFTIESVPARMEKLGTDPMAEVLTTKPDLVAILARLAERM